MIGLIDVLLDKLSSRLAQNLTENMETVAQNKAAREFSKLSDNQLHQAKIVRQQLDQSDDALPCGSSYYLKAQELDEQSINTQRAHLSEFKNEIVFLA